MPKDRFLIGILSGIGVLILAALVLFFIRQSRVEYQDDSTPGGAVHNYILALQRADYERAYPYLADQAGKPTLEQFRQAFQNQSELLRSTAVEIGTMPGQPSAEMVQVSLTMMRSASDFLGETYRDAGTATLVRQGSAWKIQNAPYPFWSYEWLLPVTPGPAPAP